MDIDTPLTNDIDLLLTSCTTWKNKYTQMCNDVKEMECVIKSLKEELRIARNYESTSKYQLSRCQVHLNQTQEIVNQLLSVKDEALRAQEEKNVLEGQLEDKSNMIKFEREEWGKDKAQIITSYDEKIKSLKKCHSDEVTRINNQLTREKEELNKIIDELKMNITESKKESEKVLTRTIGNYEEKLMQMNKDIAAAQTEIKNLRQRWEVNRCLYPQQGVHVAHNKPDNMDTMPIEGSSSSQSGDQAQSYPPQPISYPLRNPVVKCPSQNGFSYVNNNTSSAVYYSLLMPDNYQDQQYGFQGTTPMENKLDNAAQVKKATFPTRKKRKLFTRNDDIY